MNQANREVVGQSKTTFENYFHHVASVSISYGKIPKELDE